MKCHNTSGIIKITVLGNIYKAKFIYKAKLMLNQFLKVMVYIKKRFIIQK